MEGLLVWQRWGCPLQPLSGAACNAGVRHVRNNEDLARGSVALPTVSVSFSGTLVWQDCVLNDFPSTVNNDNMMVPTMERGMWRGTISQFGRMKTVAPRDLDVTF